MIDRKKSSVAEPNSSDSESTRDSKDTTTPDTIRPKVVDLDYILVNELGEFGRFQVYSILLVSLPIMASAFMSEYIFSAAAIPHRCRILECEETTKYTNTLEPPWLPGAVPTTGSGFESCKRFVPVPGANGTKHSCPAELFTEATMKCEEFVYSRTNSVVYDFNLGCQEWLRALAGTMNSIGTLLVLPFIGFISDRYGRRVAMTISVINMAVFGLIRAFSVDYPMYLALQILQSTFGAGTYSTSYVFAAELVGPKYRVLASATTASMFSFGQIILGALAWLVPAWRYFILVLHIPCCLLVLYYWLLHESVRWLLSKRMFEEARRVLRKVAKVNKKQISEKSLEALLNPPELPDEVKCDSAGDLVVAVIKSRVMLRRVCTTPVWWITTTFVYYGLSINSTSLADTMYLTYILTVAIEIPGSFFCVVIMDRIGRKPTLFTGFLFSAVCNFAFAFMPHGDSETDYTLMRLMVFLFGKFGISVVFAALYLYTSELYPTQHRHSLLAFSSMIGRIGHIIAPLTPVLAVYWEGIPSVMFGAMGLISSVLVLTQPETLGSKMPDTLTEAEAVGSPELKSQNTIHL